MRRSPALAALALLVAACGHGGSGPARPPAVVAAAAPPPARPLPPPDVDLLVARARALRTSGDVEGARAQLEAALAAAPADPGARLELADLLLLDGRELDRAAALVAPLQDRGDGRVDVVRGRLAEARGDDEGAVAAYAAALGAADDPGVRMRRALALDRLGRGDDELHELERLRATRPGDPFVRGHLADAYEAAGRLPEAEAELRWVAEAQPGRRAGWDRLAAFYERIGRPRDARAAADRARALSGARTERALRPLLPSRN